MAVPLLNPQLSSGSPFSKNNPIRVYTPSLYKSNTCDAKRIHVAAAINGGAMTSPCRDDFIKKSSYSNNGIENKAKVRRMLHEEKNMPEAMITIDELKRLAIDHHFGEEISQILDSMYRNHRKQNIPKENDLFSVATEFKLLREAGYDASPDIFERFMDNKGEFRHYLRKDIKGLISLHEASFLNIGGEEVLSKANEFTTNHLKSSVKDSSTGHLRSLVRHILDHPYHISLQQYRARHYLRHLHSLRRDTSAVEELALSEFQANQGLYQNEFKEVKRWWTYSGLARDLPFARDQILKWYLWSMTIIPGPLFSQCRLQLTKVISFIYLIDDIFDMMGTLEELSLLTEAIDKWEDSNALPIYMRGCYIALQDVTNEIAHIVEKQYGWSPLNNMKRSWAKLCNAFMIEARWFANKQVPNERDYLTNGVTSSGVHVVLEHLFHLLGHEITKETVHLFEGSSPLISCPAKILRLWDDLGSAKDENQEGFDGSYVECYLKENSNHSVDSAKAHMMELISKTWGDLNRECLFNKSYSPYFTQASLNSARMVSVMYKYNEAQQLPLMEDYTRLLLFGESF
ncbi:hypothetical protein LUZ60_009444 [Juncus effusus]|nr:hypothetical protein LUZ60_009444 [Juncus effusus]